MKKHWSERYPVLDIQSADVCGLDDPQSFVVSMVDTLWRDYRAYILARSQEDMGAPFRKDVIIDGQRRPVWFVFVGPEILVLDQHGAETIIEHAEQHFDDGSDWWREGKDDELLD